VNKIYSTNFQIPARENKLDSLSHPRIRYTLVNIVAESVNEVTELTNTCLGQDLSVTVCLTTTSSTGGCCC